ncbi:MAG: nucleotidyl transferase AbiEii/AbiGii toxin family protein, partial [Candidatus Thiodiazotropha sp.]
MIEEQTVAAWIEEAPKGRQREFREAVHIILSGIANEPDLKAKMVIKGGILLAIRYQSHRYTKDIDFSTSLLLGDIDKDETAEKLDKSMALMSEAFEYEMECRVQSCRIQPANKPDAQFPSIKMRIGYAYKYEAKYKRLLSGKCPTTIDIDFSLNELLPNIEEFDIGGGETITAYSLTDLIAEKLRSVLQQIKRERQRRQDIFDLFLLLNKFPDLDKHERRKIRDSLVDKALSRGIEPHRDSLKDPEIMERS